MLGRSALLLDYFTHTIMGLEYLPAWMVDLKKPYMDGTPPEY